MPPRCWVGIGTPMTGSERLGRQHPRQVGGPAGAGDDHPDAAPGGLLRVAEQVVRRAVGRDDPQSRTGRRSSMSTAQACSSTGKSERLPPTTPTTGGPAMSQLIVALLPSSIERVRPNAACAAAPRAARAPRRSTTRPRSGAPSCDARRPAACRTGGGGRRRLPWRGRCRRPRGAPSRDRPVPSRLTIAARRERRRRTEPEPADRPDVLLELRGRGALDRPVAAVVDPRGELVDDEAAVGHEEQLHGQRADEAHRHGQPLPELGGTRGDLGRDRRGRHGFRRGCPHRGVLRDSGNVAATPSRPRVTTIETSSRMASRLGQERLAGRPAESFERPVSVRRAVQPDLAPAVVAAGRRLDPHRQAQRGRGSLEVVARSGPRATGRPRRRAPRRSGARRCGPA